MQQKLDQLSTAQRTLELHRKLKAKPRPPGLLLSQQPEPLLVLRQPPTKHQPLQVVGVVPPRAVPTPTPPGLHQVPDALLAPQPVGLALTPPPHGRLKPRVPGFHQHVPMGRPELKAPLAPLVLAPPLRQEQRVHPAQRRLRLAKEHRLGLETTRPLGELGPLPKHHQLGLKEPVERVAGGPLLPQAVAGPLGEDPVHHGLVVRPEQRPLDERQPAVPLGQPQAQPALLLQARPEKPFEFAV